ncbi:MAG TPA: hypothetical protein VFN25_05885 [Dokdonella sp.]|uniref:hypothetical protein n=1 Tax=Dokdonella sp. TaxID=2291710 RepID=UPI002D7F305B|nr:hypothetical protein [Dokdonella sp.]HET9032416.1 hypothetical protein [Dokdonella sp.]
MTTTPEFEINYGKPNFAAQASRPATDQTLYAAIDAMVAPLSSDEFAFIARDSGQRHVLSHHVLQTLDQCREFRSIDEHVVRVASVVPGLTQHDRIRKGLEGLASTGLMVSDRDFLAGLEREPEAQSRSLHAIYIRACDRPQQLRLLLDSLANYERRFRVARNVVLLDDSIEDANRDANRDLLREFARAVGNPVSYIGPAERAKLRQQLIKAAPQAQSSIEWLLDRGPRTRRGGGGRSWNLALLLSAGRMFAMLDEDFRLPLQRHADVRTGLEPNPAVAASARFYRRLDDALDAGEEEALDPFELHLGVCGERLGSALTQDAFRLDRESLRGINLGRLEHLRGDARIISSLNGTCGASGTESALWLYQLDAESRAEFWADRESYLRNIEAQSLWYGCLRAKPASQAYFTPFVFDNREMLPCTNPDGRGEDGLASAAARFCHPGSLVLHLPTAIGHAQESQRKRSEVTMAAHTPRFNHFLRDYVCNQEGTSKAADPAHRLGLLGAITRDLAAADDKVLASSLEEYLGFVRADVVERLQNQFELLDDAPVYWQADVRSIVRNNGNALLKQGAPRLADWAEDLDAAGCARAAREELLDMAQAWRDWPALWEFARDQGDRLVSGF